MGGHFPAVFAERGEVLGHEAGDDFPEVALQHRDVEPLRVKRLQIIARRVVEGTQGDPRQALVVAKCIPMGVVDVGAETFQNLG
jgi:hypothetical protein